MLEAEEFIIDRGDLSKEISKEEIPVVQRLILKKMNKKNKKVYIATNLLEMSDLKVPILSYVIGEGGSGGALAIGVCDNLSMLEYSIYSVISPEGCASILYKNAEFASNAAEAMKITAYDLKKLNLIDEIISEPLGGAHRNIKPVAKNITSSISSFNIIKFQNNIIFIC